MSDDDDDDDCGLRNCRFLFVVGDVDAICRFQTFFFRLLFGWIPCVDCVECLVLRLISTRHLSYIASVNAPRPVRTRSRYIRARSRLLS